MTFAGEHWITLLELPRRDLRRVVWGICNRTEWENGSPRGAKNHSPTLDSRRAIIVKQANHSHSLLHLSKCSFLRHKHWHCFTMLASLLCKWSTQSWVNYESLPLIIKNKWWTVPMISLSLCLIDHQGLVFNCIKLHRYNLSQQVAMSNVSISWVIPKLCIK